MYDSLIELSNVTVWLKNRRVLRNLSFRVQKGERWAVIGPNGSGKTTLLRVVNGYLHPSTGEVSVLGGRFGETDVRELRRKIGFVSSYLDELIEPNDFVLDIVVSGKYGATRLWKVPHFDDAQYGRRLLRELGCSKFEEKRLNELSQGERQRVLIARALISRPILLTLDEPCLGLDLKESESFLRGLERMARKAPVVMIYVTHRIEEIPSFFTHAMLLKNGRVLASGQMRKVISSGNLSSCFDTALKVKRWRSGRYSVGSYT